MPRQAHHSTPTGPAGPLLLAALLLGALLFFLVSGASRPQQASASTGQLSLMMDDDLLLYSPDELRDGAVKSMKDSGVDGLRVTILWKFAAGNAKSTPARRARFRGDDPATYPIQNWDRYDRLFFRAAELGVGIFVNITGPGPPWAHPKPPFRWRTDAPSWRPNVAEYEKFVRAIGKRYSGQYRDENDGKFILPRVTIWTLFNEPNQGSQITPQSDYDPRVKKFIPISPILYRDIYRAGTRALAATGHANDFILMGETAPLGTSKRGSHELMRPGEFISELFCIAPNGRPYTGRDALVRRCQNFRNEPPFLTAGWAHHPYTQKNRPTVRDPDRRSFNMANTPDLARLLDRMANLTGKIRPGLPLVLSELGYQTTPPDPVQGIPLALQPEYMNVADRLAYDDPRVAAVTHFILRDVKPQTQLPRASRFYWATWQSGLFFNDFRPKPSYPAYLLPLDAIVRGQGPEGASVRVWGQVRYAPNGEPQTVVLEHRRQGSSVWEPLGLPVSVTNGMGFFDERRTVGVPGTIRARGLMNGRTRVTSREAAVRF